MRAPRVKVGDICEQVRGVTYSGDEVVDAAAVGYLPVLRANNITDDGLLFDDLVFVPMSRISQKQRVRQGDVVVAASSGSLSVVGKAAPALSDFEGGFGAFCKVLRPSAKVHHGYFAHFFKTRSYRQRVSSLAAGANINNLRNEHLDDLEVSLPALPEQRRIAAILDQAETLRAQRRAAIAQLDSLGQAVFLDMFGDPIGDGGARVSDFVKGFESGKSIVAEDEEDNSSPYRVLKVSAVTSLTYRPDESKALPADYVPPASHFVRAGDLLFSRANTSNLIGATAYVEATPPNLLLPDKLWRFVWFDPPRATPHYVAHLFRQPKFRAEIGQRSSGTSGSMKNISHDKVLSIAVALPALSLQQTFAHRIQSIEQLKAIHRTALARLDELFASLQHRAFRGEL